MYVWYPPTRLERVESVFGCVTAAGFIALFSPLCIQCSFLLYKRTNSFILGPPLHLHSLASNERVYISMELLMYYEMLVCAHGLGHSYGGKIIHIQWTDCRGEVVFISVRPAVFGVATLPKRCLCLPIAISSSTGVCAVKRAWLPCSKSNGRCRNKRNKHGCWLFVPAPNFAFTFLFPYSFPI